MLISHLRIFYCGMSLKIFAVVQLPSHIQIFATPWIAACQASLSFTISWSWLKLLVIPSNHLILCCPLLLVSPFPSIRTFSNELDLWIMWPKYWSFRGRISPSNEYSELISFKTDWFDLLAVQVTPKSLLQNHSLKASISRCAAFFMVQLSHLYMTTGKVTVLTVCIFVGKVISLHFNILFRFVITFLIRSKHLYFHGYSHHLQWFWSPRT